MMRMLGHFGDMSIIRRIIFAFALAAGLAPAFSQTPPPVPALPDTERRFTYSISASTCACAVGFQLYGDSTDYGNWIEVFVNGAFVPSTNYTITSPSGSLATLPRPITDAVLTFNTAQTGTVQIVGARRPRRTSQFQESQPVPTRNFNQTFSDIIATQRELWDKTNDITGRGVFAPPGETLALLPTKAARASSGACFDVNGNLVNCVSIPSSIFVAGNGVTLTGSSPTSINVNLQAGPGIQISGTNPVVISTAPLTVRTALSANSTHYVRTVPVAVTISNASPAVITHAAHTYAAGQLVTYNSTGALPTGLTAGTIYCVLAAGLATNTYEVGATCGGAAINTSSAGSGTFTEQAGNDLTGTGAAQTATQAFMTLQGAVNFVGQNIDLGNFVDTIQAACAGGGGVALYAQGLIVGSAFTGGGNKSQLTPQVIIQGDTSTPTNCQITPASLTVAGAVIAVENYANVLVQGFAINPNITNEYGIFADTHGNLWISNLNFNGATTGANIPHIGARVWGGVFCTGPYTISAGANLHWYAQEHGFIECAGVTITLTGTPAWGGVFAFADAMGSINASGDTFVGSATGARYLSQGMSYIGTNGAGVTFFPGNAGGTPATADTFITSGASCCGQYH
jgi:hypothetical protein